MERLRAILLRQVRLRRWPGVAACVFVDGRLSLSAEAGLADIEAGVPMTSTSLVRLYSMTKCVIGMAVMQLVDDGLLRLDDLLQQHLPVFSCQRVLTEGSDGFPNWRQFERAQEPIRIRHLLTHTSGIACGLSSGIDGPWQRNQHERAWAEVYRDLVLRVDRNEVCTLGSWVEELAKLPLQSHPGTEYNYGYSYDVLGRVIEVCTGRDLADYLRDRIFQPLGMEDTAFDLEGLASEEPAAKRLSVLYRRTSSSRFGADGRAQRLVRVDPPAVGAPSRWARCRVPSGGGGVASLEGGLLSTLRDFSNFLLTVVSGGAHPTTGVRVLSPLSAARMLQDLTATLAPQVPGSACPYGDAHLGLSCLGEVQRSGLEATSWFDGVRGVRLWGGAASTAFKFDVNGGRPILVVVLTQVFPQDDGATITRLLGAVRKLVAAQ